MKVAIIDDMQTDRIFMSEKISDFCSAKRVAVEIDVYESAESFFSEYTPNTYHIVFLDIYMDGMNGMDAAIRLRKQKDTCQIIFTTSSPDYAVGSYDVQAVYYLLKPVDINRLNQALSLCMENIIHADDAIEVLCNRLPVTIPLHTILYANTYHNAVHIYTTAGLFKTYITFENFWELLGSERRFLLCYKGCLVNMDHIISISENDFVFPNNLRVQIRKRGGSEVKKAYMAYLFSKTNKA